VGEIMIHVGFTGTARGMNLGQKLELHTLLEGLLSVHGTVVFHHGDCVGADAEAHKIAKEIGLRVVVHPPTNPRFRAYCTGDEIRSVAPYLDRNRAIVHESAILIATPAQRNEVLRSGTWATVRTARKAERKVIILYP
jgi:hypothetical protein